MDQTKQSDNQVILNFKDTFNGKVFENRSAKEFPLELDAYYMISGFKKGIKGIKLGERLKPSTLFFWTPYLIEDLAGKIATFVIKLHKVLKRKFHTLDNQFIEKLGIERG